MSCFEELKAIEEAGMAATDLIERLLALCRHKQARQKVVDLNREVCRVVKVVKRLIPDRITVQLQLSERPAELRADPVQLQQLLMNLMVTARDAMKHGGRLSICTRIVFSNEHNYKSYPAIRPRKYAMLSVSDNGCGMDKVTAQNVFKPFFTTKKNSQGTGLGLWTVHRIVNDLDGYIRLRSRPGVGTVFRIYMPAAGGDASTASPGQTC